MRFSWLAFLPPTGAAVAPGAEVARPEVGVLDIGAFEFGSGPPVMLPDAGVSSMNPDAAVRADGGGGGGGATGGCAVGARAGGELAALLGVAL